MQLLLSILVILSASFVKSESCTTPSVVVHTYTSRSIALSTEVDYIADFSVKCKEGSNRLNLYAELEPGHIVPVAYNDANNQYQVSWSKPHKTAVVGTTSVRVFNDEGLSAYRKAERNNEGTDKVEALLKVEVYHPGVSREGLFVQTEFLAVVVALLVWWMGNSWRSQIME
ncbi:translocon-associated protein subunit delta [Hydra vulgaris]|uniref:Translocon-associated protein subunit delta n=1 Tax=Hydra vulgaris TaxID=6087 RepID=A0ABM4DJ95_HYDVU